MEEPDRVRMALRRVLQRTPLDAEVQRGVRLLDSLQREHNVDARAAFEYYCLLAFNLNEFLYLD